MGKTTRKEKRLEKEMHRITVGSTFDSYSSFEEELDLYKNTTFSEFFIKDCKTLETAKKRYPLRVEKAKKDLKYYFVKLMCVNGGNYKQRKTTGERNVSSMRQGCNAYIYVKLSNDGTNLVITDMRENHNHKLCQELFKSLPRQRRLTPDVQQEILDMLEQKVNKKLIQEKYTAKTNKKITLKDLSNLKAKGSTKKLQSLPKFSRVCTADQQTQKSAPMHKSMELPLRNISLNESAEVSTFEEVTIEAASSETPVTTPVRQEQSSSGMTPSSQGSSRVGKFRKRKREEEKETLNSVVQPQNDVHSILNDIRKGINESVELQKEILSVNKEMNNNQKLLMQILAQSCNIELRYE